MIKDAPESALEGFYGSLVRDADAHAACGYAAPTFFLRAPLYVGFNLSTDDELIESSFEPTSLPRDRTGPCQHLAAHVGARCRAEWPWSAWRIDRVDVAHDGKTAEAVTMDGSSGLTVVNSQWRMLWAFG